MGHLKKGQAKTASARSTLSTRRSERLIGQKSSLEPESEDDTRPTFVGKRRRSGTLSKSSPLAQEDVGSKSSDTGNSIPRPVARLRPKMRPVPEPDSEPTVRASDETTEEQTEISGDKPLDTAQGPEGANTEACGDHIGVGLGLGNGGLEPVGACDDPGPGPDVAHNSGGGVKSTEQHMLDHIPLNNTKTKVIEPLQTGLGASGVENESKSIVVKHVDDSDVVLIEDDPVEETSSSEHLREAGTERKSGDLVDEPVPKAVQRVRFVLGDVEYEDDIPNMASNVVAKEESVSVKAEKIPIKPTQASNPSGRKVSMRAEQQLQEAGPSNNRADQKEATSTQRKLTTGKGKAKMEVPVDSGSEESTDFEDKGTFDNDVEYLDVEVPLGQGMRPIKLFVSWDYDTFCKKIARHLKCLVDELDIGYLAGKPKDIRGKLTPRVLKDERDYDEMVENAIKAIRLERARFYYEKKRLAEEAKKPRGRGPPKRTEPAPVEQYIIKLVELESSSRSSKKESRTRKNKKKGAGGSTSKKKANRKGSDSDSEDSGSDQKKNRNIFSRQQLEYIDDLKAKNHCSTHNQACVTLPGVGNEPGGHVKLNNQDLLYWAEKLAKGDDPTVSLYNPPKALNLYDCVRKQAKDSRKSANTHLGPDTHANTAPAMPANLQMMPPWFFGQPMQMPYSGYTPPGPYQAYPHAPFPIPPLANVQPPNDPPLAQWLKQCDSGPRGIDGHNFKSYLAAFTNNMMTRLSDLAQLTSPNDLINCTSDCEQKMPFGTASRLLDYAKSDYR